MGTNLLKLLSNELECEFWHKANSDELICRYKNGSLKTFSYLDILKCDNSFINLYELFRFKEITSHMPEWF